MIESKPAAPEPAEIAGRYQIVQKLGAGAFGTVSKAKDRILGRMVAIKTIRLEGLAAQGASLEELLERFKREAQVSAQLKHPNIVTIYDIGEAEGVSYLAMEFIDGVGLDRIIASLGRLPVERAASLGAQVADALDFAHKHGVVHRDIKPANIMVEAGDRVKVTDFGIAKVTSSAEHLTMTGSLLGTPSYMSPEQARGAPIDGRSDLFSAGCILYEMLAGQKAFRGESITALIFKIITEDPPPLKSLDANIPERMVRIVMRALAKTPGTRYQTGKELADDLHAFIQAGSMPTIRLAETPTAPGIPSPLLAPTTRAVTSDMPTVAQPPTRVAPAAATPPASAAPEPAALPAAARPASPPVSTRSVRSPQPPVAAARRKGGGAGILIALGLIGLLFVGSAIVAGYYFFMRKPAAPPAEQQPATTVAASGAASAPSTLALSPSPASAETAPAAAASAAPASVPTQGAAAPARTAANAPASRSSSATPGPAEGPATVPRRPAAPQAPATGSGTPEDFSFLDREPEEPTDGTEASRGAAPAYRSPGSQRASGYGSGRFRLRDRSPRNLSVPEMPAVGTLRYVMRAEALFHRKMGRYGTLEELKAARVLYLDVPVGAREFLRKNYRFEVEIEEDGFKVTAIPTKPGPRAFTGDDTGFVQAVE